MNFYNVDNLYIIICILFFVLIAFIIRKLKKDKYPYEKINSLVTETEKVFLEVLLLSIDTRELYVLTKVRLADIVKVKSGTKDYIKYFSKISSKHLDFVICNRKNFEPLLVIELDDSSHLNEKTIQRDMVKNNILSAAKIPILRIKPQKKYNTSNIREKIIETFNQ